MMTKPGPPNEGRQHLHQTAKGENLPQNVPLTPGIMITVIPP